MAVCVSANYTHAVRWMYEIFLMIIFLILFPSSLPAFFVLHATAHSASQSVYREFFLVFTLQHGIILQNP